MNFSRLSYAAWTANLHHLVEHVDATVAYIKI